MLTPKESDNLAYLQEQVSEIETVLHRLKRKSLTYCGRTIKKPLRITTIS